MEHQIRTRNNTRRNICEEKLKIESEIEIEIEK